MATSGRAIRVMSDPKIETVAAVQTRTKAPLRQSGDAKGLRTVGARIADPIGPSAVGARPAVHCRPPRCVRTRAPPGPPAAVTEPEPVLTTMES